MKELEETVKKLRTGDSVLIKGKEGIGKTYFLKELNKTIADSVYIRCSSLKEASESLASKLGIETKRKSVKQLINEITEKELSDKVILLDDVHLFRKDGIVFIDILRKKCYSIAVTSIKDINGFDCVVKLKELTAKESYDIAVESLSKYLDCSNIPKHFFYNLLKSCDNNPGRIREICGKAVKYHLNGRLDFNNKKSIDNFFKETKKKNNRKMNIDTAGILMIVAYIFLICRYAFYRVKEFETGYTLAMMGYLCIIVYKSVRLKIRKN